MNGNGTEAVVQQPLPPVGYAAEPASREVEYAISWVNHGIKVLNARLLAVLALVGALGVFAFALYDPSTLRLWASALYSVGVLWPTMALYFRKG